MELETAFGLVLRKHRLNLGYSQEELADSCSLDRTFISLLERGKRNPTITTIFTLSKNLTTEPHCLIHEVELIMKEGKIENENNKT